MKLRYRPFKTSGREILDILIELTYLAVIFLVPLYFAALFPTYNIFELNKAVLFQVLVLTLLLLTFLKLIFYPTKLAIPTRRFFKKYWLVPLIFIGGLSLSIISSSHPALSWFGSYERQAGLRSYLFYFIWFILISFNLLTVDNQWLRRRPDKELESDKELELDNRLESDKELELDNRLESDNKFKPDNKPEAEEERALDGRAHVGENLNRAIMTIVLSGTVAAVYGILQIFNIDFFAWPEPPYLTHRALSTFGQPNFLASWLLLIIPLSLYLTWSTNRSASRSHRLTSRIFFGFLSALQIGCLFFTGSRGGLVAAALTVFIFLIICLARTWRSWRIRAGAMAGFVIFCALIFFGLNSFSGGRVSDLLNFNYGSSGARVNFYQASADAIIKKPVFGSGLETGLEVLFPYYTPDWGVYGDVGQLADRAHNVILDTLITTGAWGLMLLIIFWYFIFSLVKDNFKLSKDKPDWLSLSLGLGAAAYLISLMFSFSIIPGELYVWLYLALIIVINVKRLPGSRGLANQELVNNGSSKLTNPLTEEKFIKPSGLLKFFKLILAVLVIILVILQLSKSIRILLADFYFNSSYSTLTKADNVFTALTLNQYRQNNEVSSVNRDYYNRLFAERLIYLYPSLSDRTTHPAATDALKNIDLSLAGDNYQNLMVKAKINRVLGNKLSAHKYIDSVITRSPYWPLGYLEKGELASTEEDWSSAIVSYQLALLNIPAADDYRLNDLHRLVVNAYRYALDNRLALIYERLHNYEAAEKYWQLAYLSRPSDTSLFKKIADTYFYRGDFKSALAYAQKGQELEPDDYNWPLAIAAVEHELGDNQAALNSLDEAIKLAPDLAWLKELRLEYLNKLPDKIK